MTKRVAIIGAGASGLPSARHALSYGIEPVVFDASDGIGGLWRYKPNKTEEPSVMRSTVINTSKEMTAYSDFPPPDDYPNFMHQSHMYEYMKLYAEKYDLMTYIKLKHKVTSVRRTEDYDITGKWIVEYIDDKGSYHKEIFDGVLLAYGHHTIPYIPDPWPEQDQFQGNIIHSHDYKDLYGYDDQVVAVIGIGNSACDIAVELSRVAKQVYLITRRGTWLMFRLLERGMPFDLGPNSRFNTTLRSTILRYTSPKIYSKWAAYNLQKKFDHDAYGLKPKHGPFNAHLTINDELPNRLACGKVKIKPNVKSFIEHGLNFDDGTSVEHVDTVILSTGYSFNFDLVENGNLIKVHENRVDLYQYMFPPDLSAHNTLAVVGLIQGNTFPCSEMQARVYFNVLSGNSKLPSRGEMMKDIMIKKMIMNARFVESRRHTIQVDHVAYMDGLADLIGCKPDWKEYLLSDPTLAYHLLFGPSATYTYRLKGPRPWSGARKAIVELDERVYKGINPHGLKKMKTSVKTPYLIIVGFAIFIMLLYMIFA